MSVIVSTPGNFKQIRNFFESKPLLNKKEESSRIAATASNDFERIRNLFNKVETPPPKIEAKKSSWKGKGRLLDSEPEVKKEKSTNIYQSLVENSHFDCAKVPGLNDRKLGSIKSIQPNLRSFNRGSFRASQNENFQIEAGMKVKRSIKKGSIILTQEVKKILPLAVKVIKDEPEQLIQRLLQELIKSAIWPVLPVEEKMKDQVIQTTPLTHLTCPRLNADVANILIHSHPYLVNTQLFLEVIQRNVLMRPKDEKILLLQFVYRLIRQNPDEMKEAHRETIKKILESIEHEESFPMKFTSSQIKSDMKKIEMRLHREENPPKELGFMPYTYIKECIFSEFSLDQEIKQFVLELHHHSIHLFKAITREHLNHWNPKTKEPKEILDLINQVNQVRNFVEKELYSCPTVRHQANMCRFFMQVTEKLWDLNNFHLVLPMSGALTCSKVLKNGGMWTLLHKWDLKLCQRIIHLDDFVGKRLNFNKQTEYIDSLNGKPCVPYFGAFLNAFTNLRESPTLLPATDQVNLDKMNGLSKVQGKITLCQANLSHPPIKTKTNILEYIQNTELELSDSMNFAHLKNL